MHVSVKPPEREKKREREREKVKVYNTSDLTKGHWLKSTSLVPKKYSYGCRRLKVKGLGGHQLLLLPYLGENMEEGTPKEVKWDRWHTVCNTGTTQPLDISHQHRDSCSQTRDRCCCSSQ